jgi:rod shape determining protein RodA
MTSSALTRPGERQRLVTKLAEIDWRMAFLLCAVAGVGAMMLYSIANSDWQPWAAKHLIRFALCFGVMLALALVDLRVWFALAYPVYAAGFVLLLAVEAVGRTALGATRWLELGPISIQPSEIMKIGLVLSLARFYHVSTTGCRRRTPSCRGSC